MHKKSQTTVAMQSVARQHQHDGQEQNYGLSPPSPISHEPSIQSAVAVLGTHRYIRVQKTSYLYTWYMSSIDIARILSSGMPCHGKGGLPRMWISAKYKYVEYVTGT